jgi:hypothetical protein
MENMPNEKQPERRKMESLYKAEAEKLYVKTHELMANVETTIANSQRAIVEEILIQTEKLVAVDKRVARIEDGVFGDNRDPNNHGMVHEIAGIKCRLEIYDEFITDYRIEKAGRNGEAKGAAKAVRVNLKNKEITVKIGVALIALIGVVLSSTVLQTLVDHAFK